MTFSSVSVDADGGSHAVRRCSATLSDRVSFEGLIQSLELECFFIVWTVRTLGFLQQVSRC